MHELRDVQIDVEAQQARVGAGVVWEEVVNPAAEHGLVALHGSSPDVGVAGYTLGGGMGWLARKHGLAANSVTAIEVVTADGEFHRVDHTHERDLFFALRGGGGNFGVVTAFEFKLFPLETGLRRLADLALGGVRDACSRPGATGPRRRPTRSPRSAASSSSRRST